MKIPECAIHLLDLSLPSPEENLALDEALLRLVESEPASAYLRFWESEQVFVVLGVSARFAEDADVERCRRDGVPILRRASGGGTVLQGPGCLNFTLAVPLASRPDLADVRRSFAALLEPVARALEVEGLAVRGTGDLALGERKVGGSAQKRTPRALVHQGSLLYAFDLDAIARYLKEPRRRPEWRGERAHADFVANLPLQPEAIRSRLAALWGAQPVGPTWPLPALERLIAERYGRQEWNERF